MPLIPASAGRDIPWKNGGGLMRDIAVHPPSAGFEAFEWRVSLARITRDGPFSAFPGIDRLFVAVEGEGLELDVEGVAHRMGARPFAFPGEAPVFARLGGGQALALNVMTRRGAARASVEMIDHAEVMEVVQGPKVWLLLALAGVAELESDEECSNLGPGDAWLGVRSARIRAASTLRAALVSIW